jgi:hypothetical protein
MGSAPKEKEERPRKKPGRVYVPYRVSVKRWCSLTYFTDRLLVPSVEGSNCAATKLQVAPKCRVLVTDSALRVLAGNASKGNAPPRRLASN